MPDIVEVVRESELVEVVQSTSTVEVIEQGAVIETGQGTAVVIERIVGEQGRQGDPGATTSLYYMHTQTLPSSGWSITHNLGKEPNVSILIGGEEVEADVHHGDVNTTFISFPSPQTGKAVLS